MPDPVGPIYRWMLEHPQRLSEEEKRKCVEIIQGSNGLPEVKAQEARERLVRSDIPFVYGMALCFRNSGVPLQDLMSEGCVGIFEAAARFDPNYGTKFLTFSRWRIYRNIREAAVIKGSLIRVPEKERTRLKRMKEARIDPPREELAASLIVAGAQPFPLDPLPTHRKRNKGDKPPFIELLRDAADSEALVELALRRSVVRAEISKLPRRLQAAIVRHIVSEETLEQIGRDLHLSRESVRHLKDRAITRLRENPVLRELAS